MTSQYDVWTAILVPKLDCYSESSFILTEWVMEPEITYGTLFIYGNRVGYLKPNKIIIMT